LRLPRHIPKAKDCPMPPKSILWNVPEVIGHKTGGERQNSAYLCSLQKHWKKKVKVLDAKRNFIMVFIENMLALDSDFPKIIVSDSYYRNRYILINWMARIMGLAKPVSLSWQPYANATRKNITGLLSRCLFWLYYRPCVLIVTNSTGTQGWIKGICDSKNTSILNPSPDLRGNPPKAKTSSDPIRLLTVGNIRRIKGFHVLLRALKRLESRNWQLTIFGRIKDKDYYTGLERSIAENRQHDSVIVVTDGDRSELYSAYAKADIYIQPSIEEGYGMAIAEAMTFGLPVIASNTGGIPDLIKDGINGYLVAPENEGELSKKIALLIKEPVRRAGMGAASRAISKNFPDWSQNAERFIEKLGAL
jgi:glycosyltransferase involved in cell wall biosynthesis